LNFGNNFFATGDYVVAGVGLRGLGDATGYATGTISMPDTLSVPATGVPPGAQIVAVLLYWQTVESSQTAFVGQQGFFRPVFAGGPATGYPITGLPLGDPSAPVSWSAGGCAGSAQGSKTIRTYRSDVRTLLPVDSEGNVMANGAYEVRLADSGSNGSGTPITLGATLVIIYRVLSPDFPLNSVVIYDGTYSPSNSSSTMSQTIQGFYQVAGSPISKLTHIVGNGQSNKFESVYLNGSWLPSLFSGQPPFPGYYNGDWDNPTWSFSGSSNPLLPPSPSALTEVVPTASNSGCVSWGAVILSTTVEDSDDDGLLDVWEQNSGYCDAAVNNGVCTSSDPSWVSLPGANPTTKDIFVQIDYMCSIVNPDGTCDTTTGHSHYPPADALTMMTNAFAPHDIVLHPFQGSAIQEVTCTDGTLLCQYPGEPGVAGWKGGFELLKNQPLNYPDESSCEAATAPPCERRFQHGRKDSYHYALFAHAIGIPNWAFIGGSLVSVGVSGDVVTFTTSTPHGLVAGIDRVTVVNSISNPSLTGTFSIQNAPSPTSFTIQIPTSTADTAYTHSTDPLLAVSS